MAGEWGSEAVGWWGQLRGLIPARYVGGGGGVLYDGEEGIGALYKGRAVGISYTLVGIEGFLYPLGDIVVLYMFGEGVWYEDGGLFLYPEL